MPYIKQIDRITRPLSGAMTPGELNFRITELVSEFLMTLATSPLNNRVGVRYAHINSAIGVLECAKLELYRRIAVPYEDVQCDLNGDVYPQEIITP